MATNTTESEAPITQKDNSMVIAIVLPSLFAVVLVMLVAIAFILPKLMREESASAKEERRKKRMARLESSVKAQHFVDWAAKQRDEHPRATLPMNPLCVICLDEIEDAAQIRGLGCLHVFHQECLDDWFSRWNEYCPLCHRPIVPGTRQSKRANSEPPPVAFLV